MKPIQLFLLLAVMFSYCCKNSQAKKQAPEQPESAQRIEIIDPEALLLLDTSARIEVVGEGFAWTEGPLHIADGDYFLFSDIPNNKVCKWKEGQGVTTYLTASGGSATATESKEPGSNGLLLHPDGHLVLCQHGDRRMAKMTAPLSDPKPIFQTLADRYNGMRLNSPNDAVYHSNGDLYFTDPPYGLAGNITDTAKDLDFQGVYRLQPNGRLDLVTKDLKFPNGIALSPDGKSLYVASSDPANYVWMKYELDEKGLAKSSRVFYEAHTEEGKHTGAPDGMKVNKAGYIFATGPGGVWLFNAAGKLIGRIYTGQLTSNCALSSDEKVLFMTCDDYVMQLRLK
jgi:gluconolactonase